MAQYQTEAIVLSVRNWGDADKRVTLFSREYGKISAIAYGARRPKNRMAGSLQLFTYVELILSPGSKVDTVRQCEIKTSFRSLREDLVRMAYGVFILELVDELWPDRQPETSLFDLLLSILSVLQERNPRLVALAAAWQLLKLAGFEPGLDHCVRCGCPLNFPAKFDPQAGGGICLLCSEGRQLDFSIEEKNFFQDLLQLKWATNEGFIVKGKVLMEMEKKLIDYLFLRLDRHLQSLAFIRKVTS